MKNSQQETIGHGDNVAESGSSLLRSVQRFNWLLLAVLIAGSWYMFSRTQAQSVLIGGLLASVSFFMLRRDIDLFMTNFSQAGMNWRAVKKLEKIKFFLKFYGRLTALAFVLFLLVTWVSIDVIGLVIGLSTIMLSVIIVVLSKGSMVLPFRAGRTDDGCAGQGPLRWGLRFRPGRRGRPRSCPGRASHPCRNHPG